VLLDCFRKPVYPLSLILWIFERSRVFIISYYQPGHTPRIGIGQTHRLVHPFPADPSIGQEVDHLQTGYFKIAGMS
jgi:hypothetical protein